MVQVGDNILEAVKGVSFNRMTPGPEQQDPTVCVVGNPDSHDAAEYFKGKKIVVFGVPGAFTPGCSFTHLPGFRDHHAAFVKAGVDEVAVHSTNDAFVLASWIRAEKADAQVKAIADWTSGLAKAFGTQIDIPGMGSRTARYAALIDNGVVKIFDVEPARGVTVSSAESILAKISASKL